MSLTCVISLIAALAFALIPLVRMAFLKTPAGLHEGSRTSAGTHWRRLGAHLVVAELAIAVVLLVGAGLAERMNRLPSTSLQRSSAWLVGGFAALALVLSIVGLYGVVAYCVGQRTREIGVRMALGAQQTPVYRLILGEATWLVGAGTGLGIIGAVIVAMLMLVLSYLMVS